MFFCPSMSTSKTGIPTTLPLHQSWRPLPHCTALLGAGPGPENFHILEVIFLNVSLIWTQRFHWGQEVKTRPFSVSGEGNHSQEGLSQIQIEEEGRADITPRTADFIRNRVISPVIYLKWTVCFGKKCRTRGQYAQVFPPLQRKSWFCGASQGSVKHSVYLFGCHNNDSTSVANLQQTCYAGSQSDFSIATKYSASFIVRLTTVSDFFLSLSLSMQCSLLKIKSWTGEIIEAVWHFFPRDLKDNMWANDFLVFGKKRNRKELISDHQFQHYSSWGKNKKKQMAMRLFVRSYVFFPRTKLIPTSQSLRRIQCWTFSPPQPQHKKAVERRNAMFSALHKFYQRDPRLAKVQSVHKHSGRVV